MVLLDPYIRRLSVYQYVQELLTGTVAELGGGDERTQARLRALGATETLALPIVGGNQPAASVDVVVAAALAAEDLETAVAEARRLLKPDGMLIVGCESRDRPGAQSGVSYYDLVDRLEGKFTAVTMLGQAPFVGATVVEYGVKDPEPIFDGGLVEKGERVAWYLGVAGPRRVSIGGFAVVQVPLAALPPPEVPVAAPAPAPVVAPPPPVKVIAAPDPDRSELLERLAAREKNINEFQEAARLHATELEKVQTALREKDAYLLELEIEAKQRENLREAVRRADNRAQTAETKEREARLALARLEGRLLTGPVESPSAVAEPAVAPSSVVHAEGDAAVRIAQLEEENRRLKRKEEEARAESWKHLKARSDAEAQAAEVREDTVRKLKDARKLASVELMRAMEEATKKAVSLREELARSDAERKEALAQLAQLRADQTAPINLGAAPVDAAELAAAQQHLTEAEAARQEAQAALQAEEARVRELLARIADLEIALTSAQSTVAEERQRAADLAGRIAGVEAELAAARDALSEQNAKAMAAAKAEEERVQALLAARQTDTGRIASIEAELARVQQAGSDRDAQLLTTAKAEQERLQTLVETREAEAARFKQALEELNDDFAQRSRLLDEMREQLHKRDDEMANLRAEMARISRPIARNDADTDRLELHLGETRTRLANLEAEVRRKDLAIERATATANHERARAERYISDQRAAFAERNESRARTVEAESRLSAMVRENERLLSLYESEKERARKAEGETLDRKERSRQLQRDLEAAEQRIATAAEGSRVGATVGLVRERLVQMEATLRGEEQRMAMMEEALRRAAAEAADRERAE